MVDLVSCYLYNCCWGIGVNGVFLYESIGIVILVDIGGKLFGRWLVFKFVNINFY